MSRAFVKEDIDLPEPSHRRRSASGLPPGATNFMTEAGALRLRLRLAELKKMSADVAEIAQLESVLESATLVRPPERPNEVVFGVLITLRTESGEVRNHRIVGVDEVHLDPTHVSWLSPMGKALLGGKVGQRICLEPRTQLIWTIIKLD